MEILFVLARKDDKTFSDYLAPSINKLRNRCIQVGEKQEEGKVVEVKSVTEKYSIAVNVLREQNLLNDSIIVFAHEDVNILDNLFNEKLGLLFEEKKDLGIVGVVGSEKISEHGWLYHSDHGTKGHMILGTEENLVGKGDHKEFGPIGYFDKIVSVDNCMFAVRGSLLNDITFDTDTLKTDTNVYAMDLCIQILERGYKVSVADILIFHKSKRNYVTNKSWEASKVLFNEKYKDKEFPITVDSFETNKTEVISVEI